MPSAGQPANGLPGQQFPHQQREDALAFAVADVLHPGERFVERRTHLTFAVLPITVAIWGCRDLTRRSRVRLGQFCWKVDVHPTTA